MIDVFNEFGNTNNNGKMNVILCNDNIIIFYYHNYTYAGRFSVSPEEAAKLLEEYSGTGAISTGRGATMCTLTNVTTNK